MNQFALLTAMAAAVGMTMRRISSLRKTGREQAAGRLYRRASLMLGLGAWAALVVQEGVLAYSGLMNWRTALPLHLCSVMGLLTLPMLLARSPFLWHSALLLGLPGGLAALIFPAMLTTSAPFVTALGFHWLHATLAVAPLMPFALGRRPSRACVWHAWTLLIALGCLCLVANHLTGGNYLFLSVPVAGTPLEALAQGGLRAYRLSLMALAGVLLIAQGFVCRRIWRYS
ncbi:MAG: hypothetical protein E7333_05055 [Clostridiales bacterium]|nr:hypothetical protein [Clostridiales bacterium]